MLVSGKVIFKNFTASLALYLKILEIPATADTPDTLIVVDPPTEDLTILFAPFEKFTSLKVSNAITGL